MKKLVWMAFVLLTISTFSSPALAQDKQADTLGIYFGLIGGYVIPNDMRGNYEINDLDVRHVDYGFKNNGYLYGAKVGWLTPFTKKIMAMEFEYNHITNNLDRAKNSRSEVAVDGKTQLDLFMFNVLARYPNGRFHPYIGGGIGYAYVKIDDMLITSSGSIVPHVSNSGGIIPGTSTGVFAGQLMTGLDIDITKNLVIGLGYKYIVPGDVSVNTYRNGDGDTVDAKMIYSSHNFTLSFCFLF
jgi:opacity protein-like surface antigen